MQGLRRLLSSPKEFNIKQLHYILEVIISIDPVPIKLEMVDFNGIEATMRALGYPGCCGLFDFCPFTISSVLVGYVLTICDGEGHLRWRQLIKTGGGEAVAFYNSDLFEFLSAKNPLNWPLGFQYQISTTGYGKNLNSYLLADNQLI